jgi:hypothetical protein
LLSSIWTGEEGGEEKLSISVEGKLPEKGDITLKYTIETDDTDLEAKDEKGYTMLDKRCIEFNSILNALFGIEVEES